MIQSVRLLYAPFKRFVSGHVCFVFTLTTGEELVISPEADTKNFRILLGFLPFYTLRYRLEHAHEYRARLVQKQRLSQEVSMGLTPEEATALYRHMTVRAKALRERPEKYHILLNSCISNSYFHLKHATEFRLGVRSLWLPFTPLALAKKSHSSTQ
jgi:hypothetical protein